MSNEHASSRNTADPDPQVIRAYITGFGRRFLAADLLEKFPETKTIPSFIRSRFVAARTVLDLGFGTGIWFWASFLPALERIDGVELYQEALDEAERVLHLPEVPDGYAAAHNYLGESYTIEQFRELQRTRGHLVAGDVFGDWDPQIANSCYDLVTEYGGLGKLETTDQFMEIVARCAQVLNPGGAMFFVNFVEKQLTPIEKKLGEEIPQVLQWGLALFEQAVQAAGMELKEFYELDQPEGMTNIQTFMYGYATKIPLAPG